MAKSPEDFDGKPCCIECGKPLDGEDSDRSQCHDCRTPRGKLADLDIAIRASGDSPDRIGDWPEIRHFLREKYGYGRSNVELWEFFTDWLFTEHRLEPNDYLGMPLDQAVGLLSGSSGKTDYRDYVSATEIRTDHTPAGYDLSSKRLNAFLGLHPEVRKKRPENKDGTLRKNRRLIHLADWYRALPAFREWYDATRNPKNVTKGESEERLAAVRSRKIAGK
jgi:hypothetical protein